MQTGGTNSVANILRLGSSQFGSGSYNLSGSGLLYTNSEYVGVGGSGSFTQSGGTHAVSSSLYLGYFGGSVGSYNLSGNGLLTALNETIAYSGSGGFTQSGGTNLISDGLILAQTATSAGAYNLNGGLLVLGGSGLTSGGGSAAFNFGGGTLGATAAWSSSLAMNLTGSGGNSTIDTTGGNIGLSGVLSGSGGLNKVGPNTLTLSAVNTFSGNLTVDGGTLAMPGGTLVAPTQYVGYLNTGSFAQSGGSNSLSGNNGTLWLGDGFGASGNYNLSGGALTATNEYVGGQGNGSFTQSGGTNTMINNGGLTLGDYYSTYGTYVLSGSGRINAPGEVIGLYGSGAFTQTGGNNAVNSIAIGYYGGSSGTYTLSGGSLSVQGGVILLGGYTGSSFAGFTQSGGTVTTNDVTIGSTSGHGNLQVHSQRRQPLLGIRRRHWPSGKRCDDAVGRHNSTLSIEVAHFTGSSGTYNLSGGTLVAAGEYVGDGGTGLLSQSGGNNLAGAFGLDIALSANSSGSYSLSGSGALSANYEYLGYSGTGIFTQTGGTHSVSNYITLAAMPGSSGTYNLIGGLLAVGSGGLAQGAGSAAFNFGGGTLGATAAWSSSLAMALTGSGGNATINTTGGNIALSGVLGGVGGLTKVGPGTLTLTASNAYTGPTTVNGGTLVVASNIGSTSFTANSGGDLLFSGVTLNPYYGTLRAASGGTLTYQNTLLYGSFLFGPGMHILPAGSASTFNATTINPGTTVAQNGNDSFIDVTDRGNVTVGGYLTISGGINDGGGNMVVNGTADTNSWSNAGTITINPGGVLNNHVSDLTSYGGGRITVNSGGTLNANSQGEGTALDLQDSLLVNNGTIAGTTNVYYGATAQGSGTFGPINILGGGTMGVVSPAMQSPAIAAGDAYGPGAITGSGTVSSPITIVSGLIVAPNAAQTLTLSGPVTGRGILTESGPGTLVLGGTNTYSGGTTVLDGTLIATNSEALADGSSLTIGNASAFSAIVSDGSSAARSPSVLPAASPVPEPCTLAILAAALGTALLNRRRRPH